MKAPERDLFPALQSVCRGNVFELGCGYGRLAPAFEPGQYVGMDINPTALEVARRECPEHTFVDEWVEADTILAYTVLLHVPDDDIEAMVDAMKAYPRIVIGEIMELRWRRAGNPPAFNREPDEYCALVGRDLVEVHRVAYPRYKTDLLLLAFE
jgi:SAM-dependent methyltransferase